MCAAKKEEEIYQNITFFITFLHLPRRRKNVEKRIWFGM
jgi:hypothetical protein